MDVEPVSLTIDEDEEDIASLNHSFLERRNRPTDDSIHQEQRIESVSNCEPVRNPKGAGRKRGTVRFRAAVAEQESLLRQEREAMQPLQNRADRQQQLEAARREKARKHAEVKNTLERAMEVACQTGTPLQKWLASFAVQQGAQQPLEGVTNPVIQVLDSSSHISSWTTKAVSFESSIQKVQTTYMRVAEIFLQSSYYLWVCFMARLQDLIDNHGFEGLVIGRKRRYDESPFRLRLHESPQDARATDKKSKQSVGTAKIMQSELGFFALLKRWDHKSQSFHFQEVNGMCPTWLHAIEKNSAENIAASQRDIISSVCLPKALLEKFRLQVDLPCTDRHPSNMAAERALQSEEPEWCKSHSPCLLHKAAAIQATQFKLVSGHISGMLSMGLSMQAAGTSGLLKKLLADILSEKLVVFHGFPPPHFAEHRDELHRLFLPNNPWDKNRLLHLKQKCILDYFMNGNLQDHERIHFWTTIPGLCKETVLPVFTKYVVAALIPHKCPYFNRSKWLGGELNLQWNGLLSTHHGILPELVARWVSATSDIPVGKQSVLGGQSGHACVADIDAAKQSWEHFIDKKFQKRTTLGAEPEADACQDAGKAGNEAVESVEAEMEQTKHVDADIDWAAFNRANKRKALAWANTSPGPVIVSMQLCMRPSMRFLCTLVKLASEAWQRENLAAASKGMATKSSVLEIYAGDCFETFRSGIADILFSNIKGMPACGHTDSMRTLAFRMLSRSLCAAHQLVMCYGKGCPAMLFGVLRGRVDELLSLPSCLRDELTERFLDLFPSREDLSSVEAFHMLSTLSKEYAVDILDLERNHSSIRRIVQSKSLHTWTVSYQSACCHWIIRQSASLRKRFTPKKVKKTISRKKPRKQKQGGGSWRAFLHVHARGQKFTGEFVKKMAAAYRSAKASPDFRVIEELGLLATLAKNEGKDSLLKHPRIRKTANSGQSRSRFTSTTDSLAGELEDQLGKIRVTHREATKSLQDRQDADEESIMKVSNEIEQQQKGVEHGLLNHNPVSTPMGSSFLFTPGNPSHAEFCVPMDNMAKETGSFGFLILFVGTE